MNKPLSVEDQFARNRMMESIFIPHARRRRDLIYQIDKHQSQRFIHYTSAEAAIKIINQKRLWMRNSACMSDYREVQHGFTILQRFFSVPAQSIAFEEAINTFALGAAHEAIKNFNSWWSSGTIQFKTFIASVSEHDAMKIFMVVFRCGVPLAAKRRVSGWFSMFPSSRRARKP
jgi:hypothetical protein